MRRLIPLLVATAVTAGAAPPAHAADEVITTLDRATPVTGYGGGLLWSQRDPATGRYRLMYTEPFSPPHALPNVSERDVPFDADLGPGPGGRFLAVYSRCGQEPKFDALNSQGPPDYTEGRDCDLYQYDLLRKEERKLHNASSPTASEVLPTVWNDRIAFTRIYDRRGDRSYIYERARTKGTPSRRMPAGSPSADDRFRAHTTSMELYGRRLALSWIYSSGHAEGPGSQIRLDDTKTKDVDTVDDFEGGGLTTIERATPGFDSGKLYYARLCQADPGGCPHRAAIVRYRYSTGDRVFAQIGHYDLGIAVGDRHQGQHTVYVLRDSDGFRACFNPDVGHDPSKPTCSIVATTPNYESPSDF